MKKILPQRQNFNLGVTFQALSADNLKTVEKVVQQGQKFELWLK